MPKSAVIVELNSCKNSCIFCNPNGLRIEIDKEKLREIERGLLSQVLNLKKKGCVEIEISGCDPIEYEKISFFVKWLKEKMGFKFIQISTHGRNLCNLQLVKELKNAKLDQLRIPLYGSNKIIHDSVTLQKGSFKETLKGIQNVIGFAYNINLCITSVIIKQNYKDIRKIFMLASKYASSIVFSIPAISDTDYAGKFIIPFNKMKPYLISLLNLGEKNNVPLTITDIPFCIFGFYRKNIINLTKPPITSNTYSIPQKFTSNIPNIPSYRIKIKLMICKRCILNQKCDGFYNKYVDLLDLNYLKPL